MVYMFVCMRVLAQFLCSGACIRLHLNFHIFISFYYFFCMPLFEFYVCIYMLKHIYIHTYVWVGECKFLPIQNFRLNDNGDGNATLC